MSKEKQIEEMASIINGSLVSEYYPEPEYIPTATELYNAGYRKQSEWISVDERLPDIELHKAKAVVPDVLFPCLVVREGNIVSYIEKAWYWGAKFTTQDCTDITDSITHWMPLPEAPKIKGGADKPKVTCLNCKHLMFSDMYGECDKQLRIVNPSDTCEYAEPKERGK